MVSRHRPRCPLGSGKFHRAALSRTRDRSGGRWQNAQEPLDRSGPKCLHQQRGCGHFHPVTRRAPCCTMPDKFGGLPSTLVPHGWIRPLFVGAVSAGAPASIRASWSLPVIKLADAQGMAIFIASARSRAYATPTAMGTDISVIEALVLVGLGERGESPWQGRPHRGVSRANRWRPVVAQHGWQMTGPTRRW
jgi:hypothetical protein